MIRNVIKLALILTLIDPSLFACKLWAVCARSGLTLSTLSSSDRSILTNELTTLYYQSEAMLDGWAFLGYDQTISDSLAPIYRSGSPATEDSTLYWNSVDILTNQGENFIGIGHLRVATSGSNSIPNPHPWMFYADGISYSLIHNGTVSKDVLYDLITDNGSDLSWLEEHEPQTFGSGDWKGDGWASVVDSELVLLYIMKHIHYGNDLISGLQNSLINILGQGVNAHQLNMIFSEGENLYVFGGSNGLSIAESSEHYAVMTQPPNDTSLEWIGLDQEELVILNASGISRHPDFTASISGEKDDPVIPDKLMVDPAYPNPFNGSISFRLTSMGQSQVSVTIFSITGKKIEKFRVDNIGIQGQEITWSPREDIATGTYFINVRTKNISRTQKILYIK